MDMLPSPCPSAAGDDDKLLEDIRRKAQFEQAELNQQHPKNPANKMRTMNMETVKDQIKQSLLRPSYDVSDYYVSTGIFQHIATNKIFEFVTLGVIGFNAIWISVDTDYNNAMVLLDAQPHFQIAEHFFCYYFAFEWFVRYKSFRRKKDGCKDPWFVFDSIMVAMMVAETWIMTAILLLTGAGGSGGMGNASILRLARLLRLSRMMRMARLLRAMPELLILIKAVVAALRSVFFVIALLAVILYVFGIMFTQLLDETSVGKRFFPNVAVSMHSLLMYGTLPGGIVNVIMPAADASYVYAAFFYVFVLLGGITLMNMVIGILCTVVSEVAKAEMDGITRNYVREKIQTLIDENDLDKNGDGEISKSEFMEIIEFPEATKCLDECGINVITLLDLIDFIFEDHNEDSDGRPLSIDEFVDMLMTMRGSNIATIKDFVGVRRKLEEKNNNLWSQLDKLCVDGDDQVIESEDTPGEQDGKAAVGSGDEHVEAESLQLNLKGSEHAVLAEPISKNDSMCSQFAVGDQHSLHHGPHALLSSQAGRLEKLLVAGHAELQNFDLLLSAAATHIDMPQLDNSPEVNLPGSLEHGTSVSHVPAMPWQGQSAVGLRVQLAVLEQSLVWSLRGLHNLGMKLGAPSTSEEMCRQPSKSAESRTSRDTDLY